MEYILLAVVFIPLMVAIFLNTISSLLNERLTTFITINGALLSFSVSLLMFGALLLDKFKPISLKMYTWFPDPEIKFEFLRWLIRNHDASSHWLRFSNTNFLYVLYEW